MSASRARSAAAGLVVVALACTTATQPGVLVEKVLITGGASSVLALGTQVNLTAVAYGTNNTELSDKNFTWASSDPNTASVLGSGGYATVTPHAAGGPVTITATINGTPGQALFTVTQAPTISVSTSALTLTGIVNLGGIATQSVTVHNAGTGILSGLGIGTISYQSGNGWLSANFTGGTTADATLVFGFLLGGTPGSGTFIATVPITSNASGVTNSGIPQITVTLVLTPAIVLITTTSLPNGTLNVAYPSTNLTASGGTGSYTWSALSGLPSGMSLSPAGVLGGTPTQSGAFSVAVHATSPGAQAGDQTLLLTIGIPPVTITTASLPNGTLNAAYPSTLLTASGGTGSYSWSALSGLPAGMNVSLAGVLSGAPTQSGTFSVALHATSPGATSGDKNLNLTIVVPPVLITTTSLPNGTLNLAYPSTTLTASGGTGSYTWSALSGLPGGMSLSPAGVLSGTPTQSGLFSVAVHATSPGAQAGDQTLSLTIGLPAPVTITTASLPNGTVNVAYTATTLAASGGTGSYTWSALSGLPSGMNLSAAGVLSGTPTQSGLFSVAVHATSPGAQAGDRTLSLTIGAPACSTYPLTFSGIMAYTLGFSGCFDASSNPYDFYQGVLGAPGWLRIDLTSSAFAPTVNVNFGNGNKYAGGFHLNATGTGGGVFLLPAGTIAMTLNSYIGTPGPYQMGVHGVPTESEACGSLVYVALGVSASRALSSTDCNGTSRGAMYFDPTILWLDAGQTVTITMSSSAFDTYLDLRDYSTDVQQAFDDDGGGGTNSRIVYTAPASGFRKIYFTSYLANTQGAYTISIQ